MLLPRFRISIRTTARTQFKPRPILNSKRYFAMAQHGHSAACCSIPPIVSKGYQEKGKYETIGGLNTCMCLLLINLFYSLPSTPLPLLFSPCQLQRANWGNEQTLPAPQMPPKLSSTSMTSSDTFLNLSRELISWLPRIRTTNIRFSCRISLRGSRLISLGKLTLTELSPLNSKPKEDG
jgi:hypothetical protein